MVPASALTVEGSALVNLKGSSSRGHLIPSNAMKKPGVGIAQGIGVQPVKSDLERGWNLVVNKASNR